MAKPPRNLLPRPRGRRRMPPERLDEVQKAVGLCWPHRQIFQHFAERWGCSERTVKDYVAAVYSRLKMDTEEYAQTRRDRLRAALEQHYAASRAAKDFATGLRCLDRLGRLDGCFAPDKVEHSGSVQVQRALDLSGLSEEELAALERAAEKAGRAGGGEPE